MTNTQLEAMITRRTVVADTLRKIARCHLSSLTTTYSLRTVAATTGVGRILTRKPPTLGWSVWLN